YRAKDQMHKTMTLGADEFMRRFLLHVLPSGFHRIRHYGLFANAGRKANLARARALLRVPAPAVDTQPVERNSTMFICRHCGAPMAITAIFLPIKAIQAPARHQGAPP
ncbi:transposase, partial [Massilia cavernae]